MIESKLLRNGTPEIHNEIAEGEPTILYLHGLTTNCSLMEPVRMHFLARAPRPLPLISGATVFRPNFTSTGSYRLEDYLGDLEKIVRHKGLKKFSIVGVSPGGAVAMAYAVKHPGEVESLVLISAPNCFWKSHVIPKMWLGINSMALLVWS